ncbi:MAG: LrgB family protein [Holophaga sp.]|nr:LrgB family protein [Holophaga sp.]
MWRDLQPVAWAAITVGLYLLARAIYQRHAHWFTSPLLVTWALCFSLALVLHVNYRSYLRGTHWLLALLGPAVMAFAIPIYEQRKLIRRNWMVLALGVVAGSVIAFGTSWLLAWALGLSPDLRRTLLPRSVTTPFALAFVKSVGGSPELTATCVVITGLFGASLGELLLTWLPLRSAFARGALFGMGAHSVGTAKAREVGEVEGSVAGLIMVLAGILSVLVAPVLAICMH